MTKDRVSGVVRALLACASGYLIGAGYDAALVNEAAGAVGVLVVSGWSLWDKRGP